MLSGTHNHMALFLEIVARIILKYGGSSHAESLD